MYLRRIDLQGFKTFPRRTTFEFRPGVTAIVGPNGAGKSNLSDAIRWAMGEQAPRLLRIRRAEDVIFGGSDSRRRTGMADVRLTFDNAADWLPTEFDEVVIGRRLFRTGASEYTINGVRVRLRDVLDLMSAGSASHGGHSVINQGQVEQVLQQRPEDRRAFLEEAAGVARFYARRDQAWRRLTETRRNLQRLRDLTAEIESRLDTLREQAQVAERGADLQRELREGQMTLARHRLFTVNRQLEAAEEREQQATETLAGLLAEPAEELRRQAAEALLRSSEIEQGLAKARNQVEQARREAAERAAQRARLVERQRHLESRHTDLSARGASLAARAEALAEEAQVAEQSLAELDAHVAQVQSERQRLLETLAPERERRGRMQMLAGQLASARDRRTSLRERRRHLLGEGETLEAEITRLTDQVTDRRDLATAARAAAEVAEREAQAAAAGVEQAADAQRAAVDAARAAQQAQARAQAELRAGSEASASLERELEALRDATAHAGGTDEALRALREATPDTVIGRFRDRMRPRSPEASRLLEAAFANGLDALLVASPAEGSALRAAARDLRLNRLRWRPAAGFRGWPYEGDVVAAAPAGQRGTLADMVEAIGPDAALVRRLLSRVLVADNLDAALRARQDQPGFADYQIVTLDGDAIDVDGTVRLSAEDAAGRDVGKRLAKVERALHEAQRRQPELEHAARAADRALRAADDALRGAEADRAAAASTHQHAHAAATAAIRRHQRAEAEAHALGARTEDAGERLGSIKGRLEELAPRVKESEQDVMRLSEELDQSGEAAAGTAEAEAQLAALEATLGVNERRAVDLRTQAAQRRTAASQATAEAGALERERMDAEQALTAAVATLVEMDAVADGEDAPDEGLIRQLESEALEARLDLQRLQMRTEVRAQEQARAEAEVAAGQRETERLVERRAEIRSQARDDLGIERLEAGKASTPVGQIERRTAELRRLLDRLGPINPLAPEEYERERSRVEDARQQIADLEGAETNLQTLARDLQQQLHTEFMATFETMNAAFSETFTDLFGGGEAHMTLTSPNDIEQTGVEFSIRMPGKRPQQLAALSGGERALVSAALILALLKIRPPPFCILDEVDAALDDQNVMRFCQQVQRLSERTQILLITHNALSVEAASTVYGVTMREDGVSELLSLRLDGTPVNGETTNGHAPAPAEAGSRRSAASAT
ncbi:MAG: chromosome segregation protein SMC [Chloroflexota bacterium]|nr:chromosome segregation protein SMC [Chloroflexota bacterium]MDE2919388.1 chromosome segregation protein SMC [Chloroflexota bacterium]